MNSTFRSELDRACQRGFHVRYFTDEDIAAPPLFARMAKEYGDDLVTAEERLGPRVVNRAILPFRFEVRAGERSQQVSLLLRHSSSESDRETDQRTFEELLTETLQSKVD